MEQGQVHPRCKVWGVLPDLSKHGLPRDAIEGIGEVELQLLLAPGVTALLATDAVIHSHAAGLS